MKRLLFIFNPFSGRAKIQNYLYEILDFYTQKGYLVTLYPTQFQGDGYEFISRLTEDYERIVCSGGDGTLNEIVSGILDYRKEQLLAYIPFGSTNDFGRSIGIPLELKRALEITCRGIPFNIDVGCFNKRYFIYVAAFGAFTQISYTTPQKRKNALGYLAYVLEGIKALSELKSYDLTLEYENGVINGNFIIGLITNSFSIAGLKNPSYSVTELNDGVFEILLVRMPKNILDLKAIAAALLSDKLEPEHMVCIQTSQLKIKSEPIDWTFDGEYGGNYEEVKVSVMNKALNIIVDNE